MLSSTIPTRKQPTQYDHPGIWIYRVVVGEVAVLLLVMGVVVAVVLLLLLLLLSLFFTIVDLAIAVAVCRAPGGCLYPTCGKLLYT